VTPKRDLPVPERIPGVLVEDPERHWNLRYHLADLCGIKGTARYVYHRCIAHIMGKTSWQAVKRDD
jgi:hypothetical protein